MRRICLILCLTVYGSIIPVLGQISENGPLAVYASQLHGRPTASGGIYDKGFLTAAHASLPFGTLVRVANFDSGKMVDVMINDRKGPDGRLLNLSEAAANAILLSPRAVVHGSLLVVGRIPPQTARISGSGGSAGGGFTSPPVVLGATKWTPPKSKGGLRLFRPMTGVEAAGARTSPSDRPAPEVLPLNASTRPVPVTLPANYSAPAPPSSVALMQKASPAAPYRVQFGAFRRAGNANELSAMLGSAGIPSSVFVSPDTGLNVVVTDAGYRSADEAQRWIDFEGARRGWRERPVVIR